MASNTTKRIGAFELIDHGIERFQYPRGCGVAFTGFANVVTGIGDDPAEAIGDCLEQMAMSGFDVAGMEARIMEQEEWGALPTRPSVAAECEYDETHESHYHVSIRWNEAKPDNVRVIITKYALTAGMFWATVKPRGNGLVQSTSAGMVRYRPSDYAATPDEAKRQFEKKKTVKLASLQRAIAKLESAQPVIRDHA